METKSNLQDLSLDRQNVSFKFTKKLSKAVAGNKLEENKKKVVKDYVISVVKNKIKSTTPIEKEEELVIPLIKKNNWRISNSSTDEDNKYETKLKDMAVQELIKESMEKNEEWENRQCNNVTLEIPLIMQNKVPEGYETDDKMDVSLRPNESCLEDYERVPIEKFGVAILKGMGWKEGDPIGANSKMTVEPVQVQLRPKGLGLGADASALNKAKEKKENNEKLDLIKGAYVRVIQGNNKGFYGEVLGLDEENARAIVKLSGIDKTFTLSELCLEVVNKKEFDKESKVINRATYEKYCNEHQEREKERMNSTKEEHHQDSRKRSHKSSSRNSENTKSHSKKHRHKERGSESSSQHSNSNSVTWVKPQLRVRLVDDQYKKGKYFNEKVIVVDVLSARNCTCKTENNKYLEDISPSMLETVVPRSDSSYVMIVQGKYSGELCTILERNKSKCMAAVQFLSDRNKVLEMDFDAICEYVGDVSQFD